MITILVLEAVVAAFFLRARVRAARYNRIVTRMIRIGCSIPEAQNIASRV